MTPDEQEIYIIWDDRAESWNNREFLLQLLIVLEQNPIGSIQEMDINKLGKWQAHDREKALTALQRGRSPSLGLRSHQPDSMYMSIQRRPNSSGILHQFNRDADIDQRLNDQTLLAFCRQIAQIFPDLYRCFINNPGINLLYEQEQIPELPSSSVGRLKWYYLLSPACYSQDFRREDLLNAPAYLVREWENGWIELQSYEHLLEYNTPANRQRVADLTRYLYEAYNR